MAGVMHALKPINTLNRPGQAERPGREREMPSMSQTESRLPEIIADDIAINRKFLGAMIEADSHSTLEAANGIEALQILNSEEVDVVSDVPMPHMDGFWLCDEIRTKEHLPDPAGCRSSTYSSPSHEKLAFDPGAGKYLSQPSSAGAVLTALREAVATQQTLPQPARCSKSRRSRNTAIGSRRSWKTRPSNSKSGLG
jgi:CheY-like chemotaxis protein